MCHNALWVECAHHKVCLHNEEDDPGVRPLLSPKSDRLGLFLVSSSLLDNSGFEEEDDDDAADRDRKRHELHGESHASFGFSTEIRQ